MKTIMLSATLALGTLMMGCSSPCDALQDLCNKCKDSATKESCQTTVSTYKSLPIGGGTDCQAVLDSKVYDSCN
jgi:hypothetical protein